MDIPNRSSEVAAIVEAHPEVFVQGEHFDDNRRTFLKAVVIPRLNQIDGGRWGYMVKTDEGDKVPCDIIMWRDTRHIVDVFAGDVNSPDHGATWDPYPNPPTAAWVWTPVDAAAQPIPGPTPTPSPAVDVTEILARLDALEARLRSINAALVAFDESSNSMRGNIEALEARPSVTSDLLAETLRRIKALEDQKVPTKAIIKFWGMTLVGKVE